MPGFLLDGLMEATIREFVLAVSAFRATKTVTTADYYYAVAYHCWNTGDITGREMAQVYEDVGTFYITMGNRLKDR